ncbi:hypothetical protein HNQ91_001187 [Filimonas zeae]|nr:SusD/RagB family nutrient-binding outer membrane lipoprotein [Filimonas zeae]MDR6338165.1 hypothetical protein [Filimonas zeae]
MLRKKRTLVYAVMLLALGSCTKNFDKINTNPNSPENINADYLMSEVVLSSAYAYQTDAFKERPVAAGRYITLVQTTINDLFTWGAVGWDDIYSRLSVNQQMYNQAEANGEKQYLAIAKIMKAFNFGYLTDLYGDVPFSQALQSKTGNVTQPVYDQQEKIYPAILQLLEDANELLRNNPGTINADQDVLFAGKPLQWRKFANALRLRMLLRASKKYTNAFADMQTMLNDADRYPLPASNADDASVKYIEGTAANSWPGSTLTMIEFDFTKTKASKELVDNLTALNDPRLAVWVAPVASQEGSTVNRNKYVGVPNAIDDPRSYNGGETHQSTLGSMFRKGSGDMLKASMITYTEVCFILAEALQAGKITIAGKTAADYYNAGVQASMTFYGVQNTAVSNGYYDQAAVKYNGTLEQLITQKWLAMIFKGAEGWFDHRRTGYPHFTIGPLAVKNIVPRRYRYPTTELANNRTNYQNAVKTFGEDDEYTLMWYLK